MPTVLRHNGFDVMIYTRDHEPKHVHVFRAGTEVEIYLHDFSIKAIHAMKRKDVNMAVELVKQHREYLLSEWERIGPIS